MSLYGDYIKEHRDDEIIEDERGFATYRFIHNEGGIAVYIVDIYVRPELRKHNIAIAMADEICRAGKKIGCKELIGTVAPKAKNATDSLKVLLAYGMKLHSASNDVIIFRKDI